jgi:hypothetical protein
MAKFITRLIYSSVEGHNRLWITEAPFVVESDLVGVLEIPAGFMFDGNSLPRAMWWLSLPTDYMETGCVHDFLYRYGKDRKLADQVYKEFLAYQGGGRVRTTARYWALRLFGGPAFKAKSAESTAQ